MNFCIYSPPSLPPHVVSRYIVLIPGVLILVFYTYIYMYELTYQRRIIQRMRFVPEVTVETRVRWQIKFEKNPGFFHYGF